MCLVCSGDELLLTEMIFNGVFNDLTVQQCVALLSCFVFEEKVNCRVSRKVMFNSPCNLASVKLFKVVYLHCVTHEKMFVGNVLLNRWLLFVNVYPFGCRLQGQTFNPLNYFFGRATFLTRLSGCLAGFLNDMRMPLILSTDFSLFKFILKTE